MITVNLASITYAIKVKKMFIHSGIKAELTKTGSPKNKESCVYGVKIRESDLYSAVELLKSSDIQYTVADSRSRT